MPARTENARAVVVLHVRQLSCRFRLNTGVVLLPRPVARTAAPEAVQPGTPMNRVRPDPPLKSRLQTLRGERCVSRR